MTAIVSKLKKNLDSLFFQILKKERGCRCQLCGRRENVGTFHILPKGSHPRLRYARDNVILACWMPCHHTWHHDIYKAKAIEKKIMMLLGEDYEERLLKLEVTMPRHSSTYLEVLLIAFRKELDELTKNKRVRFVD